MSAAEAHLLQKENSRPSEKLCDGEKLQCPHTHTAQTQISTLPNCYLYKPKMNYKLWLTKQKIEFHIVEKGKSAAHHLIH